MEKLAQAALTKECLTPRNAWLTWLAHKERIIGGVVVIVGLVYALSFAPGDLLHDAAAYVMLAKSMVTGQGYKALNLPGSPSFTQYPPGFPALLAPVLTLFPEVPANLPALQLVPAILGWLVVPLVYLVLRKLCKAEPVLSAAIALVGALLHHMIRSSVRSVLTESPYLFFSFAALLLLQAYSPEALATQKEKNEIRLVVVALLVAASYMVRTVGLTLFVTTVTYFLWRRDPRRAILSTVLFLVLIAPWAVRNIDVGSGFLGTANYYGNFLVKDFGQPHLGQIEGADDLAFRLLRNCWGHATETILQLLVPTLRAGRSALVVFIDQIGLNWAVDLVGLGLVGLILAGLATSIRRGLNVTELYVVFYTGMILLPPWYEVRNLLPIAPLLLYYLVRGGQKLLAKLPFLGRYRGVGTCVTAALLAVVLVSNLLSARHSLYAGAAFRSGQTDERETAFRNVSTWIDAHVSKDAIIVTNYAVKLYLYTDRLTVRTPPLHGDAFVRYMDEHGVDFAVIELPLYGDQYDRVDELYLWPAIKEHPEVFLPVYETSHNRGYTVYRISRTSNRMP